MGRYQGVLDLLDKAVGGSAAGVGAHGAFWRNKLKGEFLGLTVFGQKLLVSGGA